MMDRDTSPILIVPSYQPSGDLVRLVRELVATTGLQAIVVNDGSESAKGQIFDELGKLEKVSVVHHAVNLGKGAALKTAFNRALLDFPDSKGVITARATTTAATHPAT